MPQTANQCQRIPTTCIRQKNHGNQVQNSKRLEKSLIQSLRLCRVGWGNGGRGVVSRFGYACGNSLVAHQATGPPAHRPTVLASQPTGPMAPWSTGSIRSIHASTKRGDALDQRPGRAPLYFFPTQAAHQEVPLSTTSSFKFSLLYIIVFQCFRF